MQSQSSDIKEKVIDIHHLRKSFGTKEVLKDLNLNLIRGENLVVLGKSGTGKSVLIKCIVGLILPDAGDITVLEKDVIHLAPEELNILRAKIGFLFQGAALYDSMSVEENMLFPLRRHYRDKSKSELNDMVDEALNAVGLIEAKKKMPSELSGGMKKRVGLARTIVLKPEIMLYDEPTTGLDPVTSREISELICEMQVRLNISSIIITHDIACAKITANRVAVLRDGTYAAEGSFEEISMSQDPWIRSFFE